MEFRKIFDDTKSEQLYKQIHDAQTYIYTELEKSISKKLILQVLEKKLLPVLIYPETDNNSMPMWYSRNRDHQVNIHTPVPEVRILTVKEWVEFTGVGSPDSFYELIEDMKRRVEKIDG